MTVAFSPGASPGVRHDSATKSVMLTTTDGLAMRMRYSAGAAIDQVSIRGRDVLGATGTVSTGIGPISTSQGQHPSPAPANVPLPAVSCTDTSATLSGINRGNGVSERWILTVRRNAIVWRIEQNHVSPLTAAWNALPSWEFSSPDTWKAAFLGTGGVAWFHLIDSANGTLAAHTGKATFWNEETRTALRIDARGLNTTHIGSSFTRMPEGGIRFRISAADRPLTLRYDEGMHRRRYLTSREDVWQDVNSGSRGLAVDLTISAPDPAEMFPAEATSPFDAASVRALGRTVARLGVIDAKTFGSNSWRTPYGPVCLHEGHIAQLASLIQDEDYVNGYKSALDHYRDHAVRPDGRVLSRWAYTCEDAMPGTCDSLGFYEAQWGYLMDSNPDLVTNVAELFDFCADSLWLAGQKSTCERALEYMLARDTDGDGLVEMMTDDHTAQRGSDWIDIIWASHENAFVNAKMYYALVLWSECEAYLGDTAHATRYRNAAAKLKAGFNRTTIDGGFWDSGNRWYVHWRDRDGSVHGNNLVTYLNFMAIAYGLCDDQVRTRVILGRIETAMEQEHLFFWPICMFSYEEGEGLHWQFPFPVYENGDIFLTLGEVATRAYANIDPTIPIRYIGNLLERYRKDGLAYQRYLRKDQQGAGDDILAGNAMAVVGLYRNIYGLRPKHDRLIVAPVAASQIHGTRLAYELRGDIYTIAIDSGRTDVSLGTVTVSSPHAFAVKPVRGGMAWYSSPSGSEALILTKEGFAGARAMKVSIDSWDEQAGGGKRWRQTGGHAVRYKVGSLTPGTAYAVIVNNKRHQALTADAMGTISFAVPGNISMRTEIVVRPAGN